MANRGPPFKRPWSSNEGQFPDPIDGGPTFGRVPALPGVHRRFLAGPVLHGPAIANGNSNGRSSTGLVPLDAPAQRDRLVAFSASSATTFQDQCGSANSLSIPGRRGCYRRACVVRTTRTTRMKRRFTQGEYGRDRRRFLTNGRGDAWCFDPACEDLLRRPGPEVSTSPSPAREFAKGAIREFNACGERSLIIRQGNPKTTFFLFYRNSEWTKKTDSSRFSIFRCDIDATFSKPLIKS